MTEFFIKGYEAQKNGLDKSSNPYEVYGTIDGIWYSKYQKSIMALNWNKGWDSAVNGEPLVLFGNTSVLKKKE